MRNTKMQMMCVTACLVLFGGLVLAQDETVQESDQNAGSQLEFSIELYKTIMTKTFEKAELTDDQRDKIQSILDVVIPQLVNKQEQFKNLLTDEQRKMYQAAIRLAEKAKYDKPDAHDYAMKKLKLSKEDVDKYNQCKAEIESLDKKLNDDIGALLSDEQKSRLSMFKPAAAETLVYQVKLPNMKTTEDSARIWQRLMKIKGAAEFKPDLENQTAKIKLPTGTNLKKELEALEADGVELVKGFELMPMEKANALQQPQDRPAANGQSGSRDDG